MASSSSDQTRSPRKRADVTSASSDVTSGGVTSVSGHIPAKRMGSGPSQVGRVKLELCRGEDEGLGMVLTVEEDLESPSGRKVLVKSLTPGGAAEHARCLSQDGDVTESKGFRVHDRLLQIDEHVLDHLGEEDCLDVLQEIPETCVMVVERSSSSSSKTSRVSPPISPRSKAVRSSAEDSESLRQKKYEEYAHSPLLPPLPTSSPLSSSSEAGYLRTAKLPPIPASRGLAGRAGHSTGVAGVPSLALSSSVEGSGRALGSRTGGPRPPARKVRRQKSTASHLAERGLPGFQVRRVTVCREEGEGLGISIVPSCGVTKFYYQVKRLLPGGVCGQTPGLDEGDRLLECNGHSLQGLTQARCLGVLKAAGPRVTLTLLHEKQEAEAGDENRVSKSHSPRDHHWVAKVREKTFEDAKLKGVESSADSSNLRRRVEDSGKENDFSEKSRVGSVNGSSPVSRTDATDSSPVKTSPSRAPKTSPRHSDKPRTLPTSPANTTAKSGDGVAAAAAATTSVRQFSQTTSQSPRHTEDMSNPFLDPVPLLGEGGGGGGGQSQNGQHGSVDSSMSGMTSSNPFYSDVVFGGTGSAQMSAVSSNNPFYADVVLGGGEEEGGLEVAVGSAKKDGQSLLVEDQGENGGEAVMTDDVLLDLGDGTEAQSFDLGDSGPVDLFSGLQASPGEAGGISIPPPMEFSDLGDSAALRPQKSPRNAAASDDLRNLDWEAGESEARQGEEKEGVGGSQSGSNRSGESFDFLLDAEEVWQQEAASTLMDIVEEGPPQPPGDAGTRSVEPEKSQVQVDSKKPFLTATSLPANAFVLSSVGITKRLLANSSRTEAEEEEEEITPMTVHRDHQGNKLAAPSPSGTDHQRKPLTGPRKLDEGAKRDLQSVMSRMASVPRRTRVTQKGSGDIGETDVKEEEIVPVKLTRKEAEMVGEVMSRWSSGQLTTTTSTKDTPRASPRASGFQKAVGTVLDVQAGRTDLPTNSAVFTTLGVTRTPAVGQEEVEEEITPMSVHKDHLGNKHYAPSPLESRGVKLTAPGQLDKSAKLDIAALMSSMPLRAKSKKAEDTAKEGVQEEAITPTVLSKNESRIATEAVSRWLDKDAEQPQTKPTAFQSLVKNVVDSTSKPDDEAEQSQHDGPEPRPDQRVDREKELGQQTVEDVIPPSVSVSSTFSSPPTPAKPEEPPTVEVQTEKPSHPPPTSPKPPPPPVMPKPSLAERTAFFNESASHKETPPAAKPTPANNTSVEAEPTAAASDQTRTSSQKDSRPVPTQRTLRGPTGKIASLSQTTSLTSAKPFSKIGTLSVTSRAVTPSMLAAPKPTPSSSYSSSSSSQYGRTRSEEAPFLVEVLKGIVGLGIKVKVTGEGHVEVTEVQRNSPVARNGHVRVGDYILSVNGTELAGLADSRVQQILRLLPRVLVKLVVSTRPPCPEDSPKTDTSDPQASGETSPRSGGGGYTQYGVRLSAQPYSPTPSDGHPPTFSPPSSHANGGEALTVEVEEEEDDEEAMAARKLSKALSPRFSPTFDPEPPSPPKPTPRQRQVAPASPPATTPREEPATEHGSAEDASDKLDRKLTASEIVAAASRRPSGRGEDLPQPPPVNPPGENDDTAPESSAHQPKLEDSGTHGMFTPREDAPVFASVARKVSPVLTPRPKSRSSSGDKQDDADTAPTPREDGTGERGKSAAAEEAVVSHAADLSHAAPPVAAAAAKPKIPPPVAPKPKRTSSVSSDKSYSSSAYSDEASKDLPSPTLVSSRLKDFADSGSPAAEESPQSRKRVSSAARMFERKANESKPVSPLTHPTRASMPVSSVVKNFNRVQDSEPSGKSEVVMRRVSMGLSSGGGGEGDGGKRLNSALLPPGERRRSMPVHFSGGSSSSLQLTKPSSLSHLRHQVPARGGPAISEEGETPDKASPRFNSALRPRQAFSTSSSPLRSVLTPREHKEEKHTPTEDSDASDVTYRSRPSGGSAREVTPRKAMSWTPRGDDSSSSPRMIFASSSLHNTPRYGASSSRGAEQSDHHLESTMKKFDDLLSDKHTLDSDEELPKVSNSVSLDLLKNRSARKVAASMESSEPQPADKRVAQDSPAVTESKETVGENASLSAEPVEKNGITKDIISEPSQPLEARTTASVTHASRRDEVSDERQTPVVEESTVTVVQVSESSPALKKDKMEQTEKAQEAGNHLQQSESDVRSEPKLEQSKEVDTPTQRVEDSDRSRTEEEIKPADVGAEQSHVKPPSEQQQPRARKSRPSVKDTEDAYPEEDVTAALDLPVSADLSPAEDKTVGANVSMGEDDYPEEDAAVPIDVAQDTIYRQQASTIIHTVIANALKDVTSRPKPEEPAEEEEDDRPPPPPIPNEEPPPLPGAPPPPLIMRQMMGRLVDSEDLEGMLPSQGSSSARSSPRSQSDRAASSAEVSPRHQPGPAEVLQSEDVEVEVKEAVSVDTAAPNLSLPLRQHFPEKEDPEEDKEAITESDVLISFSSPPSHHHLPLTPIGVELPGKEGSKLDQALLQEEQPPVSDTLSQDSGVQDEDMSEDGLRFSHDESPTSQGDSSLFAMTPDELPAAVVAERSQVTTSKSPVPSPRSKLSPPSPRSLPAPSTPSRSIPGEDRVQNGVDRKPQEPTGVPNLLLQDDVQSADLHKAVDSVRDDSLNKVNQDSVTTDSINTTNTTTKEKDVPQPPKTSPRKLSSKDDKETTPTDTDYDSAVVKSSRKWYILDQSGSLFLHGEKNSAVSVERDVLRQVSSMLPADLAAMVTEANKDLDEAHLADSVELRVVSARGLTGRTLSVEVTQREDYFVQVTRVHSKDSAVHEADLIMSVDGRTLKHRRPAQVQSQLETTGPKGVLLTARGVKLPSSLALRLQEERTSESDSNSESPRSVSSPRANPSAPAVLVSPGVYDVIMVKGVTGVGFCLEGGKASPRGDLPILIKRIFKGGPAERCGHMRVKDEILAVNGVDFTTMRHYEAWNHLKFLDDGEIHLRIRRQEE